MSGVMTYDWSLRDTVIARKRLTKLLNMTSSKPLNEENAETIKEVSKVHSLSEWPFF